MVAAADSAGNRRSPRNDSAYLKAAGVCAAAAARPAVGGDRPAKTGQEVIPDSTVRKTGQSGA